MPRRGLEALMFPGKFLVDKIAGLKKQQQEQSRRKVTERELAHLHHKIDKLLVRLEEHEPEQAQTQDEECAICISAKATMQTFPCGHRVVCRKCFVKTIQMAVSQRLLPLRCVICRAKILRLKQLSPNCKNSHSENSHHPLSIANKLPSDATTRRCSTRQSSQYTLITNPVSSTRRSNFRQRMALKTPDLLAIPESEELDLVNAVQDREDLCPDFETADWPVKLDLKGKEHLAKGDHYHVAKWLTKIQLFKPRSILKGIRNRWK